VSRPGGAPGTAAGPILPAGPESHSGAGGAHHPTADRPDACRPDACRPDACRPTACRSYLEFGPTPAALPVVRRHARQTLAGWQLHGLTDDVELVVSELTTNAVLATQSAAPLPAAAAAPVAALYLAVRCDRLFVLIWDCCPGGPLQRAHADDAENGRGLEIVAALSDMWGCYLPGEGGKVVWAQFALPDQGTSL
jgi:Histidine kinase-like ATPase domain